MLDDFPALIDVFALQLNAPTKTLQCDVRLIVAAVHVVGTKKNYSGMTTHHVAMRNRYETMNENRCVMMSHCVMKMNANLMTNERKMTQNDPALSANVSLDALTHPMSRRAYHGLL